MKTSSRLHWFLAILVCTALAFPPALPAQAQSAGQLNRLIPNVNLQHGASVQLASAGAKVMWGDLVTTDRGGRARIVLDDGSILNVGSDSQIRVEQHDAANQRTRIQLAYGRMRASAVHLARSGSSFEVRTPTAVAGVVGTDFTIEFSNEMTSIHVYEGAVKFCNLAGKCASIAAGFSGAVRGYQAPSQAAPTPPTTAMQSVQSTSVGGGAGGGAGAGAAATAGAAVSHSAVIISTVVAAVVAPAVAVPVATKTSKCGREIRSVVVIPCGH